MNGTARIKIVRTGIILLLLGCIASGVLSFSFVSNRFLGEKIQAVLQQSLSKKGLRLTIQSLRLSSWNRLEGSNLILKDAGDGTVPLAVSRFTIHFDLISLLRHPLHPEAALQEIGLNRPSFWLHRAPDHSFNIARYFAGGRQRLEIHPRIRIKQGTIQIRDYQYGNYCFARIDGKIDLQRYPVMKWDLKGRSDFNAQLSWVSRGETMADRRLGKGFIRLQRVELVKLAKLLRRSRLYALPVRVSSGIADLTLNLFWNHHGLALADGAAVVSRAVLAVPNQKPFLLTQLQTQFSPQRFDVQTVKFQYGQSQFQGNGDLNLVTRAVQGILIADRLELADLMTLFPTVKKVPLSVRGFAKARLAVAGTIKTPLLNGEAYITNATCIIQGRDKIHGISGRVFLRQNRLNIQRLEGSWRNSLVGLTGQVGDVFRPRLDLHGFLRGSGTVLNQMMNSNRLALQTTGKLDLNLRLLGMWQNPRITGKLSLDGLTYQGRAARRILADWSWEPQTSQVLVKRISGQIGAGHFSASAKLRWLPDGLQWKISGRAKNLNLLDIPVKKDLKIAGEIDADAVAEGRWYYHATTPPHCTVFASFKGQNLTCRGMQVEEATGFGSYRDGTFKLETSQVKVGPGRIYAALSWDGTRLSADLDLHQIPVARFIPDSRGLFQSANDRSFPVTGVFNGNLTIAGSLANPTAHLSGECSGLTWEGKHIGTLTGELTYSGKRLTGEKVTAETDSGIFQISGGIELGSRPTLDLTVLGHNIQLQGFSKWLPLNPAWNLTGSGEIQLAFFGPVSKPAYRGNIEMANPGLAKVQMERGLMKFRGDFTEIQIQQLQLFRQDSRIEMAGSMSRDQWNFQLNGRAFRLDTLHLTYGGKSLAGTVDFRAVLSGGPARPLFSGHLQGREIAFGSWKYDRLETDLGWDGQAIVFNNARLSRADGTIEIHGRVLPGQTVNLDLALAVNSCDIQDLLQFVPLPQGLKITGKVTGMLEVTGPVTSPAVRFSGGLTQAFVNSVAVAGHFDLAYEHDKIQIQKVELVHEKGVLTARGVWENLKTLKIQAKLSNFPLQTVNAFLNGSARAFQITGTADSDLNFELSGSRILGAYQVNIKDWTVNGESLGSFHSVGEFSDRGLTVDDGRFALKSGSLVISGYWPWPKVWLEKLKLPVPPESNPNMALVASLKNTPARFINIWQKQFKVADGELTGKLAISGNLPIPKFNGQLECSNVRLQTAALALPVESFQATATIRDNSILFKKATGNYGPGKVNISGTASYLDNGAVAYHLELSGTKFYYKSAYYDGFGDFQLSLQGDATHPSLAGNITVYNGKAGILGQQSSPGEKAWVPELNLNLTAGNNVRFRQPGLADVTIQGDLQIKGSLLQPVCSGTLTSENGMITFYNRTFKVNRAKAVFSGSKGFTPYIEVSSSLFVSNSASSANQGTTAETEVEVFLEINGQVGGDRNLNINLHSQPYLSQSKIYALLNWPDFNAWANQEGTNSDQPLTVSGIVTGNISFITDTMFGDLFYELRRALNVDYLYLEQNYQNNDFRINIGNKLTDRLFLSYSRSIAEDPNDNWNLNFRLNSYWNVGGSFNQQYGYSWRLLYQIGF